MHGTQSRISQSEQAGIGDYLVCRSPMMVKLATRIRRYATATAPVLITGPSGSGKEHVARALHGLSARKAMPMLAVNCAAIPPALLESELFGTQVGAFTGAKQRAPVGLNVRTEGHSSSMRLRYANRCSNTTTTCVGNRTCLAYRRGTTQTSGRAHRLRNTPAHYEAGQLGSFPS